MHDECRLRMNYMSDFAELENYCNSAGFVTQSWNTVLGECQFFKTIFYNSISRVSLVHSLIHYDCADYTQSHPTSFGLPCQAKPAQHGQSRIFKGESRSFRVTETESAHARAEARLCIGNKRRCAAATCCWPPASCWRWPAPPQPRSRLHHHPRGPRASARRPDSPGRTTATSTTSTTTRSTRIGRIPIEVIRAVISDSLSYTRAWPGDATWAWNSLREEEVFRWSSPEFHAKFANGQDFLSAWQNPTRTGLGLTVRSPAEPRVFLHVGWIGYKAGWIQFAGKSVAFLAENSAQFSSLGFYYVFPQLLKIL